MAEEISIQEKIAAGEVPAQIKDLLTRLVEELERLSPSLAVREGRRVHHLTERLVEEAINPGVEMHLWEVALDFISKAARAHAEEERQVIELISQLSPALHAYFGPPGPVSLQEITEESVFGVIMLSETLTEPKSNFVAPNAISLAQALFSKHAWYRAICAGKTLAGFLMLYDDPEKPTYFLWRFMIAEPFHGRGYARQAIQRLIEHVRTRPNAAELLLSCGEGEGSPEGFYAKQGFNRTGEMEEDEVVMRIPL